MSTHNIHFCVGVREIFIWMPLLFWSCVAQAGQVLYCSPSENVCFLPSTYFIVLGPRPWAPPPLPGMPLPDFSKPPPGFPRPGGPHVPPPDIDLTPSVPYYELPAGLIAPLIKVGIVFLALKMPTTTIVVCFVVCQLV